MQLRMMMMAHSFAASRSPDSLRYVLSRLMALCSREALHKLGAARAFEWRPGEAPQPLHWTSSCSA